MSLTHYAPPAGRYKGSGDGYFLVRCLGCDRVLEAYWGKSGPGRAPVVLRSMGWAMIGHAGGSRWQCGRCTASVGRNAKRHDRSCGHGPKDEHAVTAKPAGAQGESAA